jgi:hypothetical protein
MVAIKARASHVRFEIYTLVPEWFFLDSGVRDFAWHEIECDVGLVQKTTLDEDIGKTLERLKGFLPVEERAAGLARELERRRCSLAICDISPVGLAAARMAGIPSVLVENFTWDWIYEGYFDEWPALAEPARAFAAEFAAATCRIQTDPLCAPLPCDLRTAPVSRLPARTRAQVRKLLGIADGVPMVLLTMGGMPERRLRLPTNGSHPRAVFVVPGSADRMERNGGTILLPHRSEFYHPDLVHAADAVVGKLGYSTLAECHAAGVPFGFIPRPRFRESAPLAAYASSRLNAVAIEQGRYLSGEWGPQLADLLAQERRPAPALNGADAAADFVVGRFFIEFRH